MSRRGREFVGAMLAYSTLVVTAVLVNARLTLPAPVNIALALLPLLPAGLVLRATLQAVRAQDELERRIQLEAVTFAFVTHFFLSLTYSLLEIVSIPAPNLGMQILQMGALWAVGGVLARRKYSA